MAHSDVTKDDVTKTSKVIIEKVFHLKVGIKERKTLKTTHRYDFLFPSYGQLKTDQCSAPEL